MKRFSTTLMVMGLVCSSANALETKVTNPLYMPEMMQVYSDTNVLYFKRNYDVDYTNLDGLSLDFEVDGWKVEETIRYGILDILSFDVNIAYMDYEVDIEVEGESLNLDYEGLTNPSFGLTGRVMERNYNVIDLGVIFSPDVFDADDPSDETGEGGVASGRHEFEVFARYGRMWDMFTLAGTFRIRYIDEADKKVLFLYDRESARYDHHFRYKFNLDSEILITEILNMNLNLAYVFAQDIDAKETTNDFHWRQELPYELDLRAQLNYTPIREFALGFYYEFQKFGQEKIEYKTELIDEINNETDDDMAHLFGIRAIFEF